MHIVALLLKSKGTNDFFCISLEWLNAVFDTEEISCCRALANQEKVLPRDSSNVLSAAGL